MIKEESTFEIHCFRNFFTSEIKYTVALNEIEVIDYDKKNNKKVVGKENVLEIKLKRILNFRLKYFVSFLLQPHYFSWHFLLNHQSCNSSLI